MSSIKKSVCYYCLILTKHEMSPQILDKLSNMKFQSAVFDLYLQMDGWLGRI